MNLPNDNKRAAPRDIGAIVTATGAMIYRLRFATLVVVAALAAFLTLGRGTALGSAAIVVDSTADTNTADGVLTLREAILLAVGGTGGDGTSTGLGRALSAGEADNVAGTPGAGSGDQIYFSLASFPEGNPGVITLSVSLPYLSTGNDVISGLGRGVRIDGAGNPFAFSCITIDDSDFNAVAGLQLTNCISGVFIAPGSANNFIGPGNTVYGNQYGVRVGGHDNTVRGNKIGTTVDGANVHPDGGNSLSGIGVSGPNNVLGGANSADRNIISGNYVGIDLILFNAVGNMIKGNYIGTDVTGTLDRGNEAEGVLIRDDSNTVGGTGPGEGNLISGNDSDGILILGSSATGNSILGNYIGTNAAGTASIENWQHGVEIQTATGNHVGGTVAGAGNLISGNGNMGVRIAGAGNFVEGNLVGTTAAGTAPLGNGNQGVRVNAANNMIAGNVIADSGDAGIRTESGTTGTVIKKNFVGTDATGTINLGNGSAGVYIDASSTTVGGVSASDGNVIAFNTSDGVTVTAGSGNVISSNTVRDNGGSGVTIWGGSWHRVSRNDIGGNGGLGIDIAALPEIINGITVNDAPPDADSGPNNMQNYPVVTAVFVDTVLDTTTIDGTLESAYSTFYTLDFFYSYACDPTGYGEGEVYLASGGVMTNATGIGNFSQQFDVEIPAGTFITATATDPDGNTSEFSACLSAFDDGDDDNDGYTDTAEAAIGTGAQDPCGANGWPSNTWDAAPSTNKLDIQDIISFVAPVRRLDTSPAFGGNYNARWDLAPGPNSPFSNWINIVDITTALNGGANSPAYPPMFGGLRAFGKVCPLPGQ